MAADVTAALIAHLQAGMAVPFRRPENDCCSFVADYVRDVTGRDPASAFRGAYTNETGAMRLVRRYGSMAAMWRVHMAACDFDETDSPEVGDVGVVCDRAEQIVPAIRVADGWAAKSKGGVVIEDFPMIVAWSIVRG